MGDRRTQSDSFRRVAFPLPVRKRGKIQKNLFGDYSDIAEKGFSWFACCVFLWNRVVTAFAEGVAPQNPPQRQKRSFQKAVLFQGLQSILGTGGHKPTAGCFVGRNVFLITTDKPQSKSFHSFVAPWRCNTVFSRSFTAFIATCPVLVRATRTIS